VARAQCGHDALALAEDLLARGWDAALTAEERVRQPTPPRPDPYLAAPSLRPPTARAARRRRCLPRCRCGTTRPSSASSACSPRSRALPLLRPNPYSFSSRFPGSDAPHHPRARLRPQVDEWSAGEVDPVARELLSRFRRTSLVRSPPPSENASKF